MDQVAAALAQASGRSGADLVARVVQVVKEVQAWVDLADHNGKQALAQAAAGVADELDRADKVDRVVQAALALVAAAEIKVKCSLFHVVPVVVDLPAQAHLDLETE